MEAKAKAREALAAKAQGKEALDHAIAAAEIYMRAAGEASSTTEKSRFKKKCADMISMAERLKKSTRTGSVAAVEKRLKLPRSSRQVPTGEKNILLRGSRLHGNLFPPWEADPDEKEFSGPPFVDPADFSLSERQSEVFAGWKRPLELNMENSQLDEPQLRGRLMENNGDYDLVQDITTDCSVVASLCACIKHLKPGPKSILPALMFPINFETGQPEISASGKYVFRMYFNGCFRKVVIDDRLPSSNNDRTLYVVDRQNPDLAWPALIEKAYLKVRGGYDFPGSNSGTDLWVLTGWIPQQIFLQSDEIDGDQIWRRVKKAYDYNDVVVTLGTGRLSLDEEEILGLAGEHDYAVLDISEDTSGNRRLLVKNPWCDGLVWKGVGSSSAAAATSTETSPSLLPDKHPTKLRPGTFWISFDDVVQNFESLYLNWNPSLFTERQDHHLAWQLPEPNMIHSFAHNPQYSMTAQADGSVWILLSRHFQDAELDIARGGGGGDNSSSSDSSSSSSNNGRSTTLASVSNKLGFMSLYIFASSATTNTHHESDRILLPDDRSVVYRGPFVDSPQTLAPFEARKGTRYTVVVASQDLPLPRYSFTLSFFSRSPLAVHAIADVSPTSSSSASSTHYQNPHVARVSSAWTRRTAGGNAASPTYGANPQFRLRLSPSSPPPSNNTSTTNTTVPISILLATARDDLPIRVDLVWSPPAGGTGMGTGRVAGPVPQRDLVASSGEYRRGGCALARCARADVPGVYTVVCSTFDAGQLGGFTLRVSCDGSEGGVALEPIPPDAAGRLRVRVPDLVFFHHSSNSGSGSGGGSSSIISSISNLMISDHNRDAGGVGGGSHEATTTTTTTTTTGRLTKRIPIYAERLTRATVVVARQTRDDSSTPSTPRPQRRNPAAATAAARIRLVYGSGPNRTILAVAAPGGGSGSGGCDDNGDGHYHHSGTTGRTQSGSSGNGNGEFREVGPGGLRTPEFDVDPRRGVLWLVAEQIGGGGVGQEGGGGEEDGLQVEILCDVPVQIGAWEVVDV